MSLQTGSLLVVCGLRVDCYCHGPLFLHHDLLHCMALPCKIMVDYGSKLCGITVHYSTALLHNTLSLTCLQFSATYYGSTFTVLVILSDHGKGSLALP
jgi:hypothetical protein